jgi:peptide/nickel transport system substrate-binding protein
MKRVFVLPAVVLAALLSLSVTVARAPAGPAAPPETVIVLQGVDAVTLDPHQTSSLPEANILLHIYDTLTTYDDNMKLIPGVAESFRNLPNDRSVWEFKLRPNVKFSNGEALDANAVKYSFERGMNPQIGRGNTTYLNNNLGIREVRAVDPVTVQIVTRVASPVVPGFLTEYNLVPPKYYTDTPPAQVATRPIGSGPYRLVEWRKDEQVVLEVNPNYWGPRPGPRRIVWRPVPESSARLNELIRGNADIVVNVPPDLVDSVKRVQKVQDIQGGRRIFIGITQYNHAALRDRRVRQALNYAVDVDAIAKGVLRGFGKRTASTVNPPWQDGNIKPYPFDQRRAGQLLDEAGWRAGAGGTRVRDGQPLSLTLMGPNGRYLKDRDVTQAIGSYLQQVGINLNVKIIDWPQYIPVVLQKKADDLYMIGSGTNFEGQADISDLQMNSSSNYGNWRNDDFERHWQQLIGEFDPAKRRQILSQMQEVVREDAPYIFLYFQVDIYGISNRVTWTPLPNERIRLFRASVERQ